MKINKDRWWDWTAVVCFLAALLTVAYRLIDTKWTENLNLVISLAVIGAVLGLLLGLSRFKPGIATLIGFGYTLVVVPWQLVKIVEGTAPFGERLYILGYRFATSFYLFLHNEALTDPVLFITNMALLFWLFALIGGYSLTRHGRPWLAMILAGVAIMIIDIYHPAVGKSGVAMAVFIIFAMLMITRMHFLHRKKEWDGEEVSVDNETGGIWSRGALITALVVVLLAWNVNSVVKAVSPDSPARHGVITIWNDLRTRFENAVKPLRGTTVVPREFYGDEFQLGTGSRLSDTEVFSVTPSISARIGVPYYWRVRSYDTYQDGQWKNTIKDVQPLRANTAVISHEPYNSRMNITFTFQPKRNLSLLYAPSIPLTVSRPTTLQYGRIPEGLVDITAVEVDPVLRAGDEYKVISMISAPTVSQLRGAGTNYPAWVTDTYLQLPSDMPSSISDLAASITSGSENPYDQAAAITAWLRTNIAYSQVLPQIPDGVDPIEWVLFTEKQAFCNYYATAEILMLRSLGIPSRWVVGYAQGQYDADTKSYVVSEKDSHAWPEVFFPQYGWIEFEPTASQAIISRPSGSATGVGAIGGLNPGASAQIDEGNPDTVATPPTSPNNPVPEPAVEAATTRKNAIRDAIIVGAVLILGLAIFVINRLGKKNSELTLPVVIEKSLRKRGFKIPQWLNEWAKLSRLTPIERSFLQVKRMLRFLGNPSNGGATPAEQINHLIASLPESESDANTLLDEYQKAMYSRHPGYADLAQVAVRSLWQRAIKERIQRVGHFMGESGRSRPKYRGSDPGG